MFFDPAYPSLKNGLVGYWSPVATGPTGLQLLDLSGQNNHGTLSGMDAPTNWVQSPYGTVLDFDGSNDFVDIEVIKPSSTMTLATWVYVRSFSNSPLLYTWIASSGAADYGFLETNSTGSQLFYGNRNTNTAEISFRTYTLSTALQANSWVNIVATKNAGADTGDLFVNGVKQTSFTGVLYATTSGATRLRLASYTSPQLPLNGQIAEVCAYNRTLTESEIQTIYNLGPGKLIRSKPTGGPSKRKWWPGVKTPKPRPIIPTQRGIKSGPVFYDPKAAWFRNGLVGHWCPNLTGPTGTQLLDLSGQNNNGALINYGNSLNANTIWLDSQYGTVLTANNISERVDFQNIPQINSGEVTFGFWYYPLSITGLSTVFNNWSFSQTAGGFYCFRNGATIAFQEGGASWRVTTGNILTANTWHHIVCRRSNGIGGMRIFCNGVIDPASSTAGGTQSTTQPFNLFGSYGGTGPGNCRIADFAIWNRSLTDSEIQQLYQRRLGGFASRKPYRRSSYSPAPKKIFKSRIDRKRSVSLVYPDHDHEWVTNGLVGFWCPSLTSPTGTQLLDLSGQNNNGTLTNMTPDTAWVTSGGKGALNFTNQFNVQQNRVDANSFTLANRNVFSFSGFGFLASRSASFGNGFFSWGNIGVYTTDCFLYVDGTGPLVLQVNNSSDGSAITTSNFPLGSWVHVAAVFNGNGTGNSGRIQLYINGRVQDLTFGSYTVPSATSAATGTVFRIGGYLDSINSTAYQWNGQLDDLRIYSRVLTADEIAKLYAGGRGFGFSNRPSRSPTWMVEADETIGNRRRRIICGGKN